MSDGSRPLSPSLSPSVGTVSQPAHIAHRQRPHRTMPPRGDSAPPHIGQPGRAPVRYPFQISREKVWHGVPPGASAPAIVLVRAGSATGVSARESVAPPLARDRISASSTAWHAAHPAAWFAISAR